jgi:hypothetical protein
MRPIPFICAASLALASCSFLLRTDVDDARVTRVALRQYDELGQQWRNKRPQPGRRVLAVSFSTSYDIGSLTFERGLFLGGDITLCSTREKIFPVFVSYSGIEIVSGSDERGYRSAIQKLRPGEPFTYDVWFDVKMDRPFSNPGYVSFNLSAKPQDVCVALSGHPYMGIGVGLTSNPIVVPRDLIEAALANSPRE